MSIRNNCIDDDDDDDDDVRIVQLGHICKVIFMNIFILFIIIITIRLTAYNAT